MKGSRKKSGIETFQSDLETRFPKKAGIQGQTIYFDTGRN